MWRLKYREAKGIAAWQEEAPIAFSVGNAHKGAISRGGGDGQKGMPLRWYGSRDGLS